MTHAVKAAMALLTLGACTHVPMETSAPPVSVQALAPPSPRAECAPAQVTLYFGEQLASDEPVVTPLLSDFMGRVRACEAAGGELRSIAVISAADPGQSASDARAQVRRRVERVRAALVSAGAPANKIVEGAPAQASPIMGRRAEIIADLY